MPMMISSMLPRSIKGLDHGVLVDGVDVAWTVALAKLENRLNDAELGSSGIKTLNTKSQHPSTTIEQ